jgi:hypothetical protein
LQSQPRLIFFVCHSLVLSEPKDTKTAGRAPAIPNLELTLATGRMSLAGGKAELYSGGQSVRPRNNPWQISMEKKK